MQVTTEAVKKLRELTSAGVMDCRNALIEAGGDVQAAIALLREHGVAIAAKKAGRAASEGLVEAYVHTGGRIGVLVEVNCETDFVARTPEFRELAHDIAMQVAAANPRFISPQDAPEGEDAAQTCLLLQPFIKDPQKTVQDVITDTVARLRENITVKRFARFELGETAKDGAAEV